MAIVDSQGRLFGKLSLLDVGAAIVILLVLVGIFIFPGTSGSVAQTGAPQTVEFDVMVRGLNASEPKDVIKPGNKTNVIVRKVATASTTVTSVKFLPRTVGVPQPDGSIKALADPRPELALTNDILLTLVSQSPVVNGTPVVGGEKVKVGTGIELDGPTYNFTSSVVAVRIKGKS